MEDPSGRSAIRYALLAGRVVKNFLRRQVGPRWSQDGAKMGPRRVNMGQDGANMGQDEANIGHDGAMLAVSLLISCENCVF